MERFSIELHDGQEYIVSHDHEFTLCVIPSDQRHPSDYIPYTTVVGVFETDIEPTPIFNLNGMPTLDSLFEMVSLYRTPCDFQGVDIDFADDDVRSCNKHLWIAAIDYYAYKKFGRNVIGVRPYNCSYELSEYNCSPAVLAMLPGSEYKGEAEDLEELVKEFGKK